MKLNLQNGMKNVTLSAYVDLMQLFVIINKTGMKMQMQMQGIN